MAGKKIPRFKSLRQERQFWQTHDVFDVIEASDWQIVEPRDLQLDSIYVGRMDRRGATLRVPKDLLARMGARPGSRIQARVEGRKLVIESA